MSNILCTICSEGSDLVHQDDNLYATKCGHIFHYRCLLQWLKRSNTCPQCRNRLTGKCMFRLYPTVSNENSSEDAATLQSRLDDAQHQLRQQSVMLTAASAEAATLQSRLDDAQHQLRQQSVMLTAASAEAATLQSRLDDAQHQLRQQSVMLTAASAEAATTAAAMRRKDDFLSSLMEVLEKQIQTLNGTLSDLEAKTREFRVKLYFAMQQIAIDDLHSKVLAMCDSKAKKNEFREERLNFAKKQLVLEKKKVDVLQSKIMGLEGDIAELKRLADPQRAEQHPIPAIQEHMPNTDHNDSS